MRLYLIRHGLATWPHWGGSDAERPLTPEGARLIRAGAVRLVRLGVKPTAILHSPLHRARQTAELIADALNCLDQLKESDLLRPGFGPAELKTLLRQHAQAEALMLVGHMPDMSVVTKHLTGGAVTFKEGTVACIQTDQPEAGVLLWLATSELLIED